MSEDPKDCRAKALIEEASSRANLAHANDKTGRPLADFIADAVEWVLAETERDKEPAAPRIAAHSCQSCGGEVEVPVGKGYAPNRCPCGGMLVASPEAQTAERREK